jgi:hypothetical protein
VVDRVKILVARRAYEFAPDDLRLTSLGAGDVPSQIQEHFEFRTANIATPPATFAEVPATIPPGLVFGVGTLRSPNGTLTPIRFMNIEPQRIVIDIAGPSAAIDEAYAQLKDLLGGTKAPDGSPAIGETTKILDYSEISARLTPGFNELIDGRLSDAARQTFAEEEGAEVVPVGMVLRVARPSTVIDQPNFGQAIIQVRTGTRAEERIYFSATDLTSEANVAWLEHLDKTVS